MAEQILLPIHSNHHRRGFTFIELAIAVAIVALLSIIALFSIRYAMAATRDTKRAAVMRDIQAALGLYNVRYQQYPNSPNDFCGLLNILVTDESLLPNQIDPRTQNPICSSASDGNRSTGGAIYVYVATPSAGIATSYLLKLAKETGGTANFFSTQ